MQPTFFVCIPTHDGRIHLPCMQGALRLTAEFPDRVSVAHRAGPILPRNRDMLTDAFLDSPATHMLCVDSDIGWAPQQVQALIDAGKPFIAGTYSKKQANREIPADYTGRTEGAPFATMYPGPKRGPEIEKPLWEATHVPAGFMLIERAVIERMAGAYRSLQYQVKDFGLITGLWSPTFEQGVSYAGEDVAFCRRWRQLGGEVWLHRGVVVEHYGETVFTPNEDDVVPTGPAVKAAPPGVPDPHEPPTETNGIRREMRGKLPVFIHPVSN